MLGVGFGGTLQLTLDITELRHLLTVATRPSVRAVLQRELDKCAAAVKSSAAPVAPVAAPVVAATAATGAIKLTNYGSLRWRASVSKCATCSLGSKRKVCQTVHHIGWRAHDIR